MKQLLRFTVFALFLSTASYGQITTPIIKAAFGVDGDLRSHYFNGLVQLGNDDWFNQSVVVTDTGRFVIDTTGAAGIVSRYTTQPASRRQPFYRNMRYAQFSIVNNRKLLDAVMIRDYHGDDSTVFASGSNKNGDSPKDWTCPISQGIPDKNDILDMFVHVRRAGPNNTDSLWMFGGLSLDNTTGNRYFDFEMYQTDIYYDRTTRKFYGYGPDSGHTTWQFDAAGNVTVPGDIIFSAEYQSSSLTFLEARIWINKNSLLITPTGFNWSGKFDGAAASSQFGYASIRPKTTGDYYTGLQCGNNTWGGPFSIVLQNDAVVTNYTAGQFVEFSVNLTKLGLDPVTLLGGNACGMPFRRILVKTRASASFTAELKDFVGPFDLFLPARVDVATETPYICDTGSIATIYVRNPVPTSVYQWSTINGNIVGPTTGTSIVVDTPGVYIVRQYLQIGCAEYAADTIQIYSFGICDVLNRNLYDFQGVLNGTAVRLDWKVLFNQIIDYFDIERSTDGVHFTTIGQVDAMVSHEQAIPYHYLDDITGWPAPYVYYRIKLKETGTVYRYSPVIRLTTTKAAEADILIMPNPVRDVLQIHANAERTGELKFQLYDAGGKLIMSRLTSVKKGYNVITIDGLANYPKGVYHSMITIDGKVVPKKLLLSR